MDHPRDCPAIKIPHRRHGDDYRSITALPYLHNLHYPQEGDDREREVPEAQRNGN